LLPAATEKVLLANPDKKTVSFCRTVYRVQATALY